jgi:NADH:ubiquinone oxidoreductase subunit 6 (subunit J)
MSSPGYSPYTGSCPTCYKLAGSATYCGLEEECQHQLSTGLCVGVAIIMSLIFCVGVISLYFGFRNRNIDKEVEDAKKIGEENSTNRKLA